MLDLVTQLDHQLGHHTSVRGRDFHRGFVGFDGDQGLLGTHFVAHFHQQFNHRYFVKVADVRNIHFHHGHLFLPDQAYSGLILSACNLYF